MPLVDQPKSKGGFALGDYIEVKDRLKMFYAAYPTGAVCTEAAWVSVDDDVPRVWVKALAYRTPDDPHPGVGHSWMALPGTTPYTRGSELENTETSAWGRAIGATGIALDKSVASADEVRNKEGQKDAGAKRQWDEAHEPRPELERRADGLIGTVSRGNTPMSDLGLHLQPDGSGYLGFKLKNGKSAYECVAVTPLAEQIADALLITSDTLEAQTVTVWGRIEMVPFVKGDVKREYARIVMERLQTPDWIVPAPTDTVTVPMFEEATA